MLQLTHSKTKLLLIILFLLSVVVQLSTVNLKNEYSFTPAQLDQQIQRMNYYPPRLARLGYILEKKYEVRLVDKFIENFIEVLDFNTYFPDYFPLVSLPLFLLGMYYFFSNKNLDRFYICYLAFIIIAQGFFGAKGKPGPIVVFPFVLYFTIYGLYKLVFLLKLYVKK